MIKKYINKLVEIFIKKQFINQKDRAYYKNIISGVLGVINETSEQAWEDDIAKIFNYIGAYAAKKTTYTSEQAIDFISALLIPAPSVFEQDFLAKEQINPEAAWNDFYQKSKNSYYVKYDRLKKNIKWSSKTNYGTLKFTINLSKPEKTIAQIKNGQKVNDVNYPQCKICYENIGFFGTDKTSSRQNIRFINKKIANKNFYLHFSPYGYYQQHLIVNNLKHTPMKIDAYTILEQLEFIKNYPFYFIGSNSDIPIVGASILSHAHFQAGKASFPVFKAKILYEKVIGGAKVSILHWPLSTIKIVTNKKRSALKVSAKIIQKWYTYENEKLNITNAKNKSRQNGVTTIVRNYHNDYEIYIFLRNNGTSNNAKGGIFHFHKDKWNIKQENIGLIEAAGQAILPGRLKNELEEIKKIIKNPHYKATIKTGHHQNWVKLLTKKYQNQNKNIDDFIQAEIATLFVRGLEDCGVFFNENETFKRFVETI